MKIQYKGVVIVKLHALKVGKKKLVALLKEEETELKVREDLNRKQLKSKLLSLKMYEQYFSFD